MNTNTTTTTNEFHFSSITIEMLTSNEHGRYEAIAHAAREAHAAHLTQRAFGDALKDTVSNLGCSTAVYGLALTMAKDGATITNTITAMCERAKKAADDARAKRVDKVDKVDKVDNGECNPLDLTPVQQAQARLAKAQERQALAALELEKANAELSGAVAELAQAEKAEADAANELTEKAEQAERNRDAAERNARRAERKAKIEAAKAARKLIVVPETEKKVVNG